MRFLHAKGGLGYAKAAGNYAASFYPTRNAKSKGFTQVIWTDSITHRNIEESGTMNIWFRIGNKLVTPKLTDTILGGITRDSTLKLACDVGIEVEERTISVSEIVEAYNNGSLKEAFGTGTAVTIAEVQSITLREKRMVIPKQEDSFALRLKKGMQDIQYGRVVDNYGWTTELNLTVSTS